MSVRARWPLTTLAVAAGVAGQAAAQGGGTIRGLAFDSLLKAALPGAQVWVRGTGRTATTDSMGGFRIDSVPLGRHVLVLAHPELDSVGLHDVTAAILVGAGDTADVTLAVPSLATFWRRACGAGLATRADSGVVFGIVQDAEVGARLSGAGLLLTWLGLGRVGRAQVLVEDREMRVHTDSGGAYFACGVGIATPVRVRAYAEADSTGAIEVQVGSRGVARRDLTIALAAASDSAPRRAAAVLRGTVFGLDDAPLPGARVVVRDAASTMTGGNGAFVLAGLPAGTQWVSVLAIGHAPAGRAVNLRGGDTASLAVTLGAVPIRLDTLLFVAARRSRELAEFEARRSSGWGYALTEDELKRMSSVRGAFYRFPSVRVAGSGRSVFDFQILFPADFGRGFCVANLFIDGLRASYEELAAYRAADLVGIEVYPRAMSAPARFQSAASGGCGVVLVWTKYVR